MMDRHSDSGGRKDWLTAKENGVSNNFILKGFIDSNEFTNICNNYKVTKGAMTLTEPRDQNYGITSFVARCYTKALGRRFDVEGLNYWCNVILSSANRKQAAVDMASDGFFHSPEFINKRLNDTEYVKTLYRTFLGREAETEGLNGWVSQLRSGVSRDQVLNGFAISAEFNAIMASYGIR